MLLPTDRTYADVNVKQFIGNVNFFRNKCKNKKIIAVLKASCYGHGDRLAEFVYNNVDAVGVATLDEGIRLRRFCTNIPILILGYVPFGSVFALDKYALSVSVFSLSYAQTLNTQAGKYGIKLKAHLKINSGMDRLGFSYDKEQDLISVLSLGNIIFEGIFSHYAASEKESPDFFLEQTRRFEYAVNICRGLYDKFDFIHIANTSAADENSFGNTVRIGYGLYGYGLKEVTPVLNWKARVIQVHRANKGETVGYGRTYIVEKPALIATLAIGYGDGYPRIMSNCGKVIFNGKFLPVVGRVCMDMMMVNASGSGIKPGDYVTLLGSDNNLSISAEELGFGYEVLCGISPRVKKYYIT